MRRLPSSSGLAQAAATAPRPVAVLSVSDRPVPDRRVFHSTFGTSTVMILAIFVGSAARVIPTLLAVPIQQDLNWPESYITWPIAISIAVSALGAPLAARGLVRVGMRSLLFEVSLCFQRRSRCHRSQRYRGICYFFGVSELVLAVA